jgi:lipopolysaccharide export system permease protein
MIILDRYIAKMILQSTAIVMFFLVALFTFITYVDQLGDVGRGSYGAIQAAEYVVLIIPRIIYQMFPIAALIGAIIGLGMLANNNELTVIRASGVSIKRIVLSVMKVGTLLIVIVIIIGEWIAPVSERYAQVFRSVALSNSLAIGKIYGVWARDGLRFVNIQKVLPEGKLGGVNIYELDETRKLNKLIQAKTAYYIHDNWVLEDVTEAQIGTDSVNVQTYPRRNWTTSLSPDLLSIVIVKPETLSIVGLYQYIGYLQENELDARRYELAFWSKLVLPIVTGVMIFLAIPFVFGSLRSVSIGHRIMVGTFVGIFFYITNQVFGYVGLVYNLNIMLSAVLPALGFFLFAVYKVRKIY